MELTKDQSRQLDLFLKYLIEIQSSVDLETINKKVFPALDYNACKNLFYTLKEYHPFLLYPEDQDDVTEEGFWANDYAEVFLHRGGFSQLFDIEEARQNQKTEREKLEIEKLKYDLKNAKRIFKTYWWTFTFALIAFLISLFNLISGLLLK